MFYKTKLLPVLSALGFTATSLLSYSSLHAADHQEAPATQAQPAADIGDYYAWHDGDQLNLVLTFGTFAAAGSPASYNSDLLYTFHFDTTIPADGVSDMDLYARFAQDDSGNWGLQIMGNSIATLEGAVETTLSNESLTAWAGVADDPFFFNLSGFNTTLETGILSFDPTVDDVAGLNVTAVALQLPASAIVADGSQFQTWATTNSK